MPLAVRVTAVFTVKVKEEVASVQIPNPVAVKVIVISPVVVGVKVGFNAFALLKVPPGYKQSSLLLRPIFDS